MVGEPWGNHRMSSDAPAHCPATREDLRLPDPWNGLSSWVCFKDAKAWKMLTPRHYQPNRWPGRGQAESKEAAREEEERESRCGTGAVRGGG